MTVATEKTAHAVNMDGNEVQHRFGVCPDCEAKNEISDDGYPYVNAGTAHWFYCTKHKVMWCAGINLFSQCKEETEDEQKAEFERLGLDEYRIIGPGSCG